MKPRTDCEVESSVPDPEQKVCQGRIHQKYDKPYLYESGSDIKLDTFEGDDESLLPRKSMLFRNILQTMEAGTERPDDFWNDSYHKDVKQNNAINRANMLCKFLGKPVC